jgi:hypothetical protein
MDDYLRVLERAARASPDDLVVGRAYAYALARFGLRRRHFRELVRLGDLGDATAHDDVTRWCPWPGAVSVSGVTLARPFPGLMTTPTRSYRTELTSTCHRSLLPQRATILGASRDTLVVRICGALVALSLPELTPRWRRDERPGKESEVGHDVASLWRGLGRP